MTDRLTAEQCRKAMKNDASIQGKAEKTLWHKGVRYRKNEYEGSARHARHSHNEAENRRIM